MAQSHTNPQKLVTDAQRTLKKFVRGPDQRSIRENIGRAMALLIVSQIVKTGFIFGRSSRQGVLVARSGKTTAPSCANTGWNSQRLSVAQFGA